MTYNLMETPIASVHVLYWYTITSRTSLLTYIYQPVRAMAWFGKTFLGTQVPPNWTPIRAEYLTAVTIPSSIMLLGRKDWTNIGLHLDYSLSELGNMAGLRC